MEQFTVPQFIDVEDKILGPLSVRQFLILMVGAMAGFIFYKLADFTLFVFLAVADLAVSGLFAFMRINGVPFHFFLLNILQTSKRPKLRVWRHEVSLQDIKADLKAPHLKAVTDTFIKRPLGETPLSQLSLIVDTGGMYKGE